MKRIIIIIIITIMIIGCQTRSDESKDSQVYKAISKDNYQSFKDWNVFIREGEDIYVFDYKERENFVRLLVKVKNKTILIRSFIPNKDSTFVPMDKYNDKQLIALGIDKNSFFKNINICFKNGLEGVSYKEKLNGVVIEKEGLTFINLFSTDRQAAITGAYIGINKFWYSAKTNYKPK